MADLDHAVVIGLNHYEQLPDDQQLDAPVHDALAFARWVTEPGAGRAAANGDQLTLCLSPPEAASDTPFAALAHPATKQNIEDALNRYRGLAAPKDVPRLWVYVAGHAVAPPTNGRSAAPHLLGSDYVPGEDHDLTTVELEKLRQKIHASGPPEQLFFLDTCRLLQANSIGTQTLLTFSEPDAGTTKQGVLYATTAGSEAYQLTSGVFTEALLRGLTGRAPLDKNLTANGTTWRLHFHRLGEYVQAEVERVLASSTHSRVQVPAPLANGRIGVVDFPSLPKATVRLFVQPRPMSLVLESENTNEIRLQATTRPVSVQVPYGALRIAAEAAESRASASLHTVNMDPIAVPVRLVRSATKAPPPSGFSLHITPRDARMRFDVYDERGELVERGLGTRTLELEPRSYEIRWSLLGEGPLGRTVVEPHDPRPRVGPDLPVNPLAAEVWSAFSEIRGDQPGVFEPSEAFGQVVATRLSTVLGWAAAATMQCSAYGSRLRRIGIDRPHLESVDDTGVIVVIADGSTEPGPLPGSVHLEGPGERSAEVPCASVPGLAERAVQATCSWRGTESGDVRLRPPGGSVVAFPMPAAPGWTHVLVVTRELDGQIAVLRDMFRDAPEELTDRVRITEQQWRALAAGEPLGGDPASELSSTAEPGREVSESPQRGSVIRRIDPADLSPVAVAALGYRYWQAGRLDEWRRWVDALPAPAPLSDIDLLRTLPEARGVAEVQALKWWDPEERTPLFRAGLDQTWELTRDRAYAEQDTPPALARTPISGLWTAFLPSSAAQLRPRTIPRSRFEGFEASPARWIRPAELATVPLESKTGKPGLPAAAAFPVGRTTLITAGHVHEQSAGALRALGKTPVSVRHSHEVDLPYSLSDTMALLELDEAISGVIPVRDARQPTVGQRVAVSGYLGEARVPRPLPDYLSRPDASELHVFLGEVAAVHDDWFTYTAPTARGSSGGPVIDTSTGAVLGVHVGRLWDGDRFVGVGLSFAGVADDAFWRSTATAPAEDNLSTELISFELPEGWTFQQCVDVFAQLDQRFPSDLSVFTDAERAAEIRAIQVRDTTALETMATLGRLAVEPGAIRPYAVELIGSTYVFHVQEE